MPVPAGAALLAQLFNRRVRDVEIELVKAMYQNCADDQTDHYSQFDPADLTNLNRFASVGTATGWPSRHDRDRLYDLVGAGDVGDDCKRLRDSVVSYYRDRSALVNQEAHFREQVRDAARRLRDSCSRLLDNGNAALRPDVAAKVNRIQGNVNIGGVTDAILNSAFVRNAFRAADTNVLVTKVWERVASAIPPTEKASLEASVKRYRDITAGAQASQQTIERLFNTDLDWENNQADLDTLMESAFRWAKGLGEAGPR